MGGGARNDVIYLEPFSCMWVAEIFTLHHIVALCTIQKMALKSPAHFLLWLAVGMYQFLA
jgi:hypothetical protein